MPAHPAIVAAAVVGGLGLCGASAVWLSSGDRSAIFSGGMAIDVVAPTEPMLADGPVMEVGEVVDGYEHQPFVQPATFEPDTAWLPDEGSGGWPAADVQPVRLERTDQPAPPPITEPEAPTSSRWSFGFEVPLPNFAAERRERQARMEALETAERVETSTTPAPAPERLDPAARRSPEMFY